MTRLRPWCLALLLLGCSDSTGPATPASLRVISGAVQRAEVGSPLPQPLVVRVVDASGRPLPGVPVAWTVKAGGGRLSATAAETDASGESLVEWTLGPVVGENTAIATVGSLPPAAFAAVAVAGAAAALERLGGDEQTAAVGEALAQPLIVGVRDAAGNPVEGVSVAWKVTAGEGSVPDPITTTDSAGHAQVSWALGIRPGPNAVTAAVVGLPEVVFTANATVGSPMSLRIEGGWGQNGVVGEPLPVALSVTVTDGWLNPVPGVTVRWEASGGDHSLLPVAAKTDSAGRALAVWAPASPGQDTARAVVDGLEPVVFTADASTGVHGEIGQNTTWTLAGSPYRITGPITVAVGATLTLEPGVHVDWGSEGWVNIDVSGRLEAVGTPSAHIALTDILILPAQHVDPAAQVHLEYVDLVHGGAFGRFSNGSLILRDSRLTDNYAHIELWYPEADSYIERNIFRNSLGIVTATNDGGSVYIRNNSFYEMRGDDADDLDDKSAIKNLAEEGSARTVVERNSFWSTDRINVSLPCSFYPHAKLSLPNNYWGTTDEAVIQGMIRDRHDVADCVGYVEYKPYLTASDPETPTSDPTAQPLRHGP
jgi:hypothetical protein